ncbi:Lichenan-specific phosphotransferase enzyme IIB component [Serratia odorifera]|uniref:Lichenan-specific phosphotransferase enzyme IIB component n=1 Tax=Serratia odorifera TaxID=618 RepID=A0A3S4DP39_SEROD|nr:Lichenan-specific phosphotransferase enzyme IIB component [Serratia odorifera]
MSTSLLVNKMNAEAASRQLPVEIAAFSASEFDQQFPNYQVVLLGPQVKYMLPALSARAAEKGVPVAAIRHDGLRHAAWRQSAGLRAGAD